MNREELRDFEQRWPEWFDFNGPLTRTLMSFGFEGIGAGWRQLLWNLFCTMEPHVSALNSTRTSQDPHQAFEVLQVKEKWGGLRVSVNRTNPGIDSCIARAQDRALRTCKICGCEGSLHQEGWWGVYCDRCYRR